MDFSRLADVLETIKQLMGEAAKTILDIYSKDFSVDYKQDSSPLTEADRQSNELIVSVLKNKYPECAILTEESEDDLNRLNNDWCFIIDPLDGTKEFIKKNGEFTINIALAYKGEAVLGVICIPVTGELYYGAKGKGSFYESEGVIKRISVSSRTTDIRMVSSRSHKSDKLDALIEKHGIKNVIIAGSAIKGCLIAKGEAEVYYRFGYTMEWDTAAMQCIVEEAGGIFRQMDNSKMTYNRRNCLNEKGFYAINNAANKLT